MKYAHVLKYFLNFTAEKPSFERSHILSLQCTNKVLSEVQPLPTFNMRFTQCKYYKEKLSEVIYVTSLRSFLKSTHSP